MCQHQTFPECGPEQQKKLKKMSPGTVTALFHWLAMTTMSDTFVQILHLLDDIVLPMHPPSLQVQGSGIPKRLRHLDAFESLAWVMWWSSVFARICGKEELAIRFGLQRLVVCTVDVCSISARNTVDIVWNLLTSVDSWAFSWFWCTSAATPPMPLSAASDGVQSRLKCQGNLGVVWTYQNWTSRMAE